MLITGYQVKRKIKDGGFSTVYDAIRSSDRQRVAIKVLSEEGVKQGHSAALRDEVRLLTTLSHPHVIKVFEWVTTAERPAYSMEYFDSMSLREALLKYGEEIRSAALNVLLHLCRGVAYLHDQGIIHRDLKPENVLVSTEGDVRLIDFSIAMREGSEGGLLGKLTKLFSRTRVQGTPQYMAPEQFRKEPLDRRTDIYALGCIIVEVLTGKPAFIASTHTKMMKAHLTEKPPTAARLDKHMPFRLAEMTVKMLAKKREQRPDIKAVNDLLETLVREQHAEQSR
jgi:serine/threonine protein kinase